MRLLDRALILARIDLGEEGWGMVALVAPSHENRRADGGRKSLGNFIVEGAARLIRTIVTFVFGNTSDYECFDDEASTEWLLRRRSDDALGTTMRDTTPVVIDTAQSGSNFEAVPTRSHRREGPDETQVLASMLGDVAEQVGIALQQANLMRQLRLKMGLLAEQNGALTKARTEMKVAQAQKDFTAMVESLPPTSEQYSNMQEVLDMMKIVKRSGDMLVSIVNNVLDFAKYEEESFIPDRVPFNLCEAVETAAEIVSLQDSEGKFPVIMTFISLAVPNIVTRFRQILVNLLSNACKFTPSDGEVVLTVNANPLEDIGLGSGQKTLPMMFEEFTQADASITRKYGGTGLGLAIARRLCHLMKGEIGVTPNPERRGTRFWFHVYLGKYKSEEWEAGQQLEFLGNIDLGGAVREGVGGICVGVVSREGKGLDEVREKLLRCGVMNVTSFPSLTDVLFASPTPVLNALIIDFRTIFTLSETALLQRLCTNPRLGRLCGILRTFPSKTREAVIDDFSVALARPIRMERFFAFIRGVLSGRATSFQLDQCVESVPGLEMEAEAGRRKLALPSVTASSASPAAKTLRSFMVLVVEDNTVNQMVIGKMLRRLGQKFDVANDGLEALKKMEEKDYDVVFMDIMMPEMDGYQATCELRRRFKDPVKPWVIGLTANAFWDERVKCKEVGMNDFISKPASLEDIKTALERCHE
ncbi:hypothetical protein BC829DRAFT_490504 [Chytridium lagenaria]|nr:hypothetical protein BC829DRAFT_490504 [Chytridium lagenaria]